MTKSDIFWKCWWWSAVSGAGVAVLFLFVTSVPVFDGLFRAVSFVDMLVGSSLVGCYAGAGYVGSRIAAKYYTHAGRFAGCFAGYSVLSFVVLVGVAFSPLSFLMILWSFVAPLCVLVTLKSSKLKQHAPSSRRPRRRTA